MRKLSNSRKTRHIVKFISLCITSLLSSSSVLAQTSERPQLFIEWSDTTFVYDGMPHRPTARFIGLVEGKEDVHIDSTYWDYRIESGEYYVSGDRSSFYGKDLEYYEIKAIDLYYRPFTINKKTVKLPTADSTPLIYNGKVQDLIVNLDEGSMILPNEEMAVNAGYYHQEVRLLDTKNYVWEDGTIETKTVLFNIQPQVVKLPVVPETKFIYNGQVQKFTIYPDDSNLERYKIDPLNESGVKIDQYLRIVNLTNVDNYIWENGTVAPYAVMFEILDKSVDYPNFFQQEFIYSGDTFAIVEKDPRYTVVYDRYSEFGDDIKNVTLCDAGQYRATISLTPGCTWKNGDTKSLRLDVLVKPMAVDKPLDIQEREFTYNGDFHYFGIPQNEGYIIDGPVEGIDPGIYKTFVALKPNYIWADGTQDILSYEFRIEKTKVAIPSPDKTLYIYNGEPQFYKIEKNPLYSVYGNERTSAGVYEVSVSLNDSHVYEWEDGTSDPKTYYFKINKVAVKIPTSDTTHFVYNGTEQFYSIVPNDYYTVYGNVNITAGNHEVSVDLIDTINYAWENGHGSNPIVFDFVIDRAKVEIPAADSSKFTYNQGAVMVYNITPNENYIVSGNAQENAGNHIVNVILADSINYMWEDGTLMPKVYEFNIERALVKLPYAIKDSFSYDGLIKLFEIEPSSYYTIEITNSAATEVGVYERTVSLNNIDNYMWEDGTTDSKIIKFVIKGGVVEFPTIADIDFTGDSIQLVPKSDFYTIDGGVGSDAGTYIVVLTLNPGYEWEDGSSAPREFAVKINHIIVEEPVVNAGEITYDGNAYAMIIPENPAYTITGETKGIEPGVYTAILSLNPNYAWADNTTEDKVYTMTISRIKVAIPEVDSTLFFYNQEELTYYIEENNNYTIEGNKQTEIGLYDVVVTLNDTVYYEWADSTVAPKHYDFEIIESVEFDFEIKTPNASIVQGEDLTINLDVDGLVQYYKINCDKLPELGNDSLKPFNSDMQSIIIPTTESTTPGKYKINITLAAGNIDTTFSVDVTINYPASAIIACWNDVVTVDKSKVQTTTYQWYKDGKMIPGATSQYYCDKAGLCGYYSCKVDGDLFVGPTYLNFGRPLRLTARSESGRIIANVWGRTSADVLLMDIGGTVIDAKPAAEEMTFSVKPGIYVLTLEGTDQSVKVIVNKK